MKLSQSEFIKYLKDKGVACTEEIRGPSFLFGKIKEDPQIEGILAELGANDVKVVAYEPYVRSFKGVIGLTYMPGCILKDKIVLEQNLGQIGYFMGLIQECEKKENTNLAKLDFYDAVRCKLYNANKGQNDKETLENIIRNDKKTTIAHELFHHHVRKNNLKLNLLDNEFGAYLYSLYKHPSYSSLLALVPDENYPMHKKVTGRILNEFSKRGISKAQLSTMPLEQVSEVAKDILQKYELLFN